MWASNKCLEAQVTVVSFCNSTGFLGRSWILPHPLPLGNVRVCTRHYFFMTLAIYCPHYVLVPPEIMHYANSHSKRKIIIKTHYYLYHSNLHSKISRIKCSLIENYMLCKYQLNASSLKKIMLY